MTWIWTQIKRAVFAIVRAYLIWAFITMSNHIVQAIQDKASTTAGTLATSTTTAVVGWNIEDIVQQFTFYGGAVLIALSILGFYFSIRGHKQRDIEHKQQIEKLAAETAAARAAEAESKRKIELMDEVMHLKKKFNDDEMSSDLINRVIDFKKTK